MKNILLSILIIMSILPAAFSQESSIYLGYKTMREININYEYAINYDLRVGAIVGVIVSTRRELNYGDFLDPNALFRKRNQQGITIGSYLNYRGGSNIKNFIGFAIEYQHLNSGNYTLKHNTYNKGQNDQDYEEFTHTYNNYSALFSLHHKFLDHNTATFYMELGFTYKMIQRYYTIDGTFNYRTPSDRVENFALLTPTIRIGLNIRIARFGEKMEHPIMKKRRRLKQQKNPNVKML